MGVLAKNSSIANDSDFARFSASEESDPRVGEEAAFHLLNLVLAARTLGFEVRQTNFHWRLPVPCVFLW